jgi:hypothetical protein
MTTKQELVSWLKTSTTRRVVLVEITGVLDSAGNSVGTIYYSNKPYGTRSTDTPANTQYSAVINGGVTFSQTLDLDGRATLGFGDIQLDNTNGVRDTLLTYIWANKAVTVYLGDASWSRADFYPIFTGFVSDIESRDRNTLNLILVDRLQYLNTAVSIALVGGTGSQKDQLKPLCFGECFNVTPVVVDSPNLIYQVHNGEIERVIEVRDNGAKLTGVTTDLANGRFTLTASPFGQITASVQGGKYGSPASYSSKVATVIQNLLLYYGRTLTLSDIDSASFAAYNTQDVGVYLNNRENLLDLCQRLANGCGLSLTVGVDGKFKLVRVLVDQVSGETHSVTPSDMYERTLAISQKVPVQGSVKLSYCKNWTPQTTGLAGALKPDVSAIFAKENYLTASSDATVLSRYNQTEEPPTKDTLLVTTAQATTEATRLLNIYKTPRYVYTATYYSHLLFCELGDQVLLTYPRFGLNNGKRGTVVQINRDWLAGKVNIGILV